MNRSIQEIIELARRQNASDVHLVCGIPVRFRVNGALADLDAEKLTDGDCVRLANELTEGRYAQVADQVGVTGRIALAVG